ncbi:hypothetical protein ACWIID_36680 [Streptomyces phaeochromogenes]
MSTAAVKKGAAVKSCGVKRSYQTPATISSAGSARTSMRWYEAVLHGLDVHRLDSHRLLLLLLHLSRLPGAGGAGERTGTGRVMPPGNTREST